MRYKLTLTMLLILFGQCLYSQSWYEIEGQYARLEYMPRNKNLADSLLTIAEQTLPRMARIFDLPLDSFRKDKVRIILTDAPDLSNGFAIGESVVIYALSSMYMNNTTGTVPWYSMVLKHELAHYVTFRKLKRKLHFVGQIMNLTTPRWFYEGTAQYYSENWNAYRGDLYLKNALLTGRLNYRSLENLGNGRLLYSSAHAFVRFLADQYGDSSLVQVMSHNADGLYYDFENAFEAVYDDPPRIIFKRFVRHMVLYYGDRWADYPYKPIGQNIPESRHRILQMLPVPQDDSTFAMVVQMDEIHRYRTAYIKSINENQNNAPEFITNHLHTDLFSSPNGRYYAFGRLNYGIRENQLGITYRWFIYDRHTASISTIFDKIRSTQATFTGNNTLVLAEITPSASVLHQYNLARDTTQIVWRTPMTIGSMDFNSNEQMVFSGQRSDGTRDLFLLEQETLHAITNDNTDDRDPYFVNENTIVFNRYIDKHPAIATVGLHNKKVRTNINHLDEYWIHAIDQSRDRLILQHNENSIQNHFVTFPVDSLQTMHVKPFNVTFKPHYASWITKKSQPVDVIQLPDTSITFSQPQQKHFTAWPMEHLISFAWPTADKKLGFGLYGMTAWIEALQRQALIGAFVIFPDEPDQSVGVLSHILQVFDSQVISSVYHGPVLFSFDQKKYIKLYQTIGHVHLQKPFFIKGNPRSVLIPHFSYSLNHHKFIENYEQYSGTFNYNGPSVGINFNYHLPTNYYPILPKREFSFSTRYFQSLASQFDFSVWQWDTKIAGTFIREELGLSSEFSFIGSEGSFPPLKTIGIDRFYRLNISRDYKFTRVVRGLDEDITGKRLYWSKNEISYLVDKYSGLDILTYPVSDILLTAFFDFARIENDRQSDVFSYGPELSFGPALARLALGFAKAKGSTDDYHDRYYIRFSSHF
ncbi:MAG: hypothetical protein GF313_13410 [Caldithrix sp.]|nr:hypothetical protein [Caldithrix sp.]